VIALTKLRTLDLAHAPSPGRPSYISAASGLVCLGSHHYVIADDEHHLAVFRAGHPAPGKLVELVAGELPAAHKARKKEKPDFEALTRLPPFGPYPHGALLAAGSGSKPNRRRGALIGVGEDGTLHGAPRIVDLSCLMTPLEAEFGKINIEGLAAGDELRVLQRGNKGHKRNAMIRFSLGAFLDAMAAGGGDPLVPLGHRDYDLGDVAGVPLTFTDAARLPNGELVFSAVAEDTADSFEDGRCGGAAVGLIAADGDLRWIDCTAEPHKIEGIDAQIEAGRLRLLMVTDADNIEIPASLFAAEVSVAR
jgi:hypothetical protein